MCQSTLNQPRTTLSVRHGPHTTRRQHIYIIYIIYFSRSHSLSYSLCFSLSSWKPDEFAVKLISFKLRGPCPESLKLWIPSPLVLQAAHSIFPRRRQHCSRYPLSHCRLVLIFANIGR